jgi:hypothetical protein
VKVASAIHHQQQLTVILRHFLHTDPVIAASYVFG